MAMQEIDVSKWAATKFKSLDYDAVSADLVLVQEGNDDPLEILYVTLGAKAGSRLATTSKADIVAALKADLRGANLVDIDIARGFAEVQDMFRSQWHSFDCVVNAQFASEGGVLSSIVARQNSRRRRRR